MWRNLLWVTSSPHSSIGFFLFYSCWWWDDDDGLRSANSRLSYLWCPVFVAEVSLNPYGTREHDPESPTPQSSHRGEHLGSADSVHLRWIAVAGDTHLQKNRIFFVRPPYRIFNSIAAVRPIQPGSYANDEHYRRANESPIHSYRFPARSLSLPTSPSAMSGCCWWRWWFTLVLQFQRWLNK